MRITAATPRIQFCPSLDFRGSKKIIPYLAELSVSDICVSPIFKARKEKADLIQNGTYISHEFDRKFKGHVIAFARNWKGLRTVSIAPQFFTYLNYI